MSTILHVTYFGEKETNRHPFCLYVCRSNNLEYNLNFEMNAVKSLSGIQISEHEKGFVRDVQNVAVEDIWTKFSFHGDLLCFQILLQTDGGKIISYQEYNDYQEYKNKMADLRLARFNNTVIMVPKKIYNSGPATLKVA